MTVLVDTPIWSLAFRRKKGAANLQEQRLKDALVDLVRQGSVQLIGPVRQELLSGVRHEEHFVRLRDQLRAFEGPFLVPEDYEEAARVNNLCRAQGIAGSPVDFLICAAASRRTWEIFTTDGDFEHYRKVLPLRLYHPA